MNSATLKQDLLDLIGQVEMDDTISDDLKEKIKDLVSTVGADPTPGNLDALTLVLDELSSLNKYKAITSRLSSMEEDDAIATPAE